MPLEVSKMDAWIGEIPDQPGGLANVLGALADAGANLESVLARRQPDKTGTGVVFLTPIRGQKVQRAAKSVGVRRSESIAALRVSGLDRPGVGAKLTRVVADAGVNLRGLQATVIGDKFVAYLAFDSAADSNKAARAIKALDAPKKKGK
jgi:predicted amino acid-binding ACT domain protein